MSLFNLSGKKQDGDSFSEPTLPTRTIADTSLHNLPMLTEVVTGAGTSLSQALGEEETQQFLHRLETHLETLFTQRLGIRLEQLQRVVIDQALDELKAELPELLREALNEHLESR
jgi:hypothetical protein